jgi:hypothetical protein
MYWTISSLWRFQLHLLLCASVVVIEFVVALNTPNINSIEDIQLSKDFKHFASKYLTSENETYTSDKRLIIEEFYRQSVLSAKSSHDLTSTELSHVNNSTNVIKLVADEQQNNETTRRDKHSVTNEGNENFIKNYYTFHTTAALSEVQQQKTKA